MSAAELAKPDSRGRVLLPKEAARDSYYIVDVSPHGTVTLTPATVRPTHLQEALTRNPEVLDDIRAIVDSGDRGVESDAWKDYATQD